ncbi:MAG: MBL fold metallo-hydrolase [Oscillospiraceae bacterium]|jgi:glyoxylase-like metal-dependent hydrolase (beta-lactamase superfamily II)|nr:MBL fold metallo-hydrolase [Oscillospiraceae bacterium]
MQVLTLPVGAFEENCYLVWQDAPGVAAVIDPGDKPEVILAALAERELKLTHILLTHGHFDHFLAAPALQKATGAPVYIHGADKQSLLNVRLPLGVFLPEGYAPPEDVRAVENGERLPAGPLVFTYRNTPGHTPGSCFIVCGDAIFSGDTLFAGDIGRTDLAEGDPVEMSRTLQAIAAWPGDFTVYPGHEEATTLAQEQAHNPYLRPPFRP